MRLSDKAAQILRLIAAGKTYDQILATNPEYSYLDIFQAADEALKLAASSAPSYQAEASSSAEPLRSTPKPPRKKTWSDADAEQVMKLYYSGYSFAKIAAKMDRTPAAVKAWINETRNADLGQPRQLGQHPHDGALIEVLPGRYGPYVKWGQQFASVPRAYHPAHVTLEEAVSILAARAERDQDEE